MGRWPAYCDIMLLGLSLWSGLGKRWGGISEVGAGCDGGMENAKEQVCGAYAVG